jgi:hypothetical protein
MEDASLTNCLSMVRLYETNNRNKFSIMFPFQSFPGTTMDCTGTSSRRLLDVGEFVVCLTHSRV